MKDYFSPKFVSLLQGLLDKNVNTRFSIQDIKSHAFFSDVNWVDVLACKQKAPINPKVQKPNDLKNVNKDLKNLNILDESVDVSKDYSIKDHLNFP